MHIHRNSQDLQSNFTFTFFRFADNVYVMVHIMNHIKRINYTIILNQGYFTFIIMCCFDSRKQTCKHMYMQLFEVKLLSVQIFKYCSPGKLSNTRRTPSLLKYLIKTYKNVYCDYVKCCLSSAFWETFTFHMYTIHLCLSRCIHRSTVEFKNQMRQINTHYSCSLVMYLFIYFVKKIYLTCLKKQ